MNQKADLINLILIISLFQTICTIHIQNKGSADASLNLVKLTDPDALCLDGTHGAYYISKQGDPNKIFIQFQGGGWCQGSDMAGVLQSCYQRSKTSLGSSSTYAQKKTFSHGVLSINQQNNFKDWTRVLLIYCDGSGHQGTKQQSISYKNTKLYFRGHNVTVSQLNSIEKSHKLFSQATEVVVSGNSAGGLAVFLWANYIKDRVKVGKVWAIPDSGIFLDTYNVTNGVNTYKNSFKNLMRISNIEIDPPVAECVQKYENQKQKCMFAQNLYEHIKVPLFPVQSLYDTWSLPHITGITCLMATSLQNCTDKQLGHIQEYHKNLTSLLFSIGSNNKNGFWAPVCALHVFFNTDAYYNASYRIPQRSQNSVSASIKDWMINSQQTNNRHIDMGKWPQNLPCAGATKFQVFV